MEIMLSDYLKKTNEILRNEPAAGSPAEKGAPSKNTETPQPKPTPKATTMRKEETAPAAGTAYFSEDVEFQGTLCFTSKLEIHGRFQGEIISKGPLVIGKSAVIKADIKANSAVTIRGKVQGNIECTERVELRGDAHLYGDITAPRFILDDGVVFEGSTIMLRDKPKEKTDFTDIFSSLGKEEQPAATTTATANPAPAAQPNQPQETTAS